MTKKYYIDYTYFPNEDTEEDTENELFYFSTLKEAVKYLKSLQNLFLFSAYLYKTEQQIELAFITETDEEFYNKRVENLFYKI